MSFRETAKTSFSWSILIQLSTQAINFIVSIILARLLFPEDFGVIGIVAIFMNLGRSLLDGGLASSLIRSTEIDDEDYSSVFFVNLFASLILYTVIFFSSPFIAAFFEQGSLISILRVYAFVIIIGAFSIVQSVRLNKNLQFKTQFKLQVPSLVISAIVGVWMAKSGYGVWSLVFKEIVFVLFGTLLLWYFSKWRPVFKLNLKKLKTHWEFGSKLLITDIFSKIFNDIYKLVIGKYFSVNQLGLYTRAKSLEELPSGIIFNAVNRVMFPLLSSIQEEESRLKNIYRQIISTVTFFVVPLLSLMAMLAEPLIIFLLTDRWIEAVPYFQILIFAGLISPIQAYLLNICKVKGRSDLVLKIASYEYFLIIVAIIPSFWLGIYWLLWSMVIVALVKTIATGYIAGRLIKYSLKEQVYDIYQPFLLSVICSLVTYFVFKNWFNDNGVHIIWELVIPSSLFIFLYLLFSHFFSNPVFVFLKAYVNQRK